MTASATIDWDQVREDFDGDQLREARELRSLTQADLAQATVSAGELPGLSPAAISQFELGDAVPSTTTLQALVSALDVDPTFLTVAAIDTEADLPAFFRSLRATPARERKRSRNVVQLVHRLAVVIDRHVGLPVRDVPSIKCDPFLEEDDRRSEAETAAAAVRRAWGIEPGPLRNVVDIVEAHGVVCTRIHMDESRVDAFSVNFARHPVAVLAADKNKWDRSRFDAAHEVGHLVMHDEAAGIPEAERQANEFAAALLMPEPDIRESLPSRPDWARLMELKAEWGVSIAALLMRSRTLGVMTETSYVSAMKAMSARGWRRHEPVRGDPELPSLLKVGMRRAREAGLDAEDLRVEATIPSDIFEEICDLITV